MCGSWSCILDQLGREQGGPCHPYGVLSLGLFQRDANNYPRWVIPTQGLCDFCKPWWGCSPLYPPAVTHLSGLGQLMDLPPGWWLWALTTLCHEPLQMILWSEPYDSCCGFVPKKLQDLWALTSLRTWFWPIWRVEHCPEPPCWWMWLEIPWLIGGSAHFLPVGKAHLKSVTGLFSAQCWMALV